MSVGGYVSRPGRNVRSPLVVVSVTGSAPGSAVMRIAPEKLGRVVVGEAKLWRRPCMVEGVSVPLPMGRAVVIGGMIAELAGTRGETWTRRRKESRREA